MPAAHHRDRGLGWAQHTNVFILRRRIHEGSPVRLCFVPFVGGDDKAGQPTERGVTGSLTLLDLEQFRPGGARLQFSLPCRMM